jgi:hypothetical protein
MQAKHCTMDDLDKALDIVNKKYAGNVRFYDVGTRGKRILFRLKTNNSKGPGVSRAASGKRTGSGCWHVHGDFFDALFQVNPEAEVSTGRVDGKITKDFGNWQDWNVGSQVNYLEASEACDCGFAESLVGTLATEAKLVEHIQTLDFKGIEELLSDWGSRYGEFILKNCVKVIRKLDAEELTSLLDKWGERYGKIIIQNCALKLLPLYVGHGELGVIAGRRLGTRRAA